jgi:hypothetical protein
VACIEGMAAADEWPFLEIVQGSNLPASLPAQTPVMRYLIVASREAHVAHLSTRSTPEPELNDGWELAAVWDLDLAERLV